MTDASRPDLEPGAAPPANNERPASREERLAAKLRENLRRRKAQARAHQAAAPSDPANHEDGCPALSKTTPNS